MASAINFIKDAPALAADIITEVPEIAGTATESIFTVLKISEDLGTTFETVFLPLSKYMAVMASVLAISTLIILVITMLLLTYTTVGVSRSGRLRNVTKKLATY